LKKDVSIVSYIDNQSPKVVIFTLTHKKTVRIYKLIFIVIFKKINLFAKKLIK